MPTLRAEIIFVAALAAFASVAPVARAEDAPRRPSPSLDVSVLRSLVASGSAAADAARADGALSLLDGLFADARAARLDADGGSARTRASRRRLLGADRASETTTAGSPPPPSQPPASPPPPPPPLAPSPPPPTVNDVEGRGFLANALLLNRLRAVVAGEEGAAQSLVASAALTSSLRNLDPATSFFQSVVTAVRDRREEAAAAAAMGTASPSSPETTPPSSPGTTSPSPSPSPSPPTSPDGVPDAFDAAAAAAAERASQILRDVARDRLIAAVADATGATADSDALRNNITDLLRRLDLGTVNLTAARVDEALAAALEGGAAAVRDRLGVSANETETKTDPNPDAGWGWNRTDGAATAYERLFQTSLTAAGDFLKSQLAESRMAGAGEEVSGADVAALVAAAVDMAESNAVSFLEAGMWPTQGAEQGAEQGANATLPPEAAVELLDRVQAVLAAARSEFTAALAESRDADGEPMLFNGTVNPSDAPEGYLTFDEIIALVSGMSGLPTTGIGFRAADDTPKLEQDFAFGGGDALVGALSGPPGVDVEPNDEQKDQQQAGAVEKGAVEQGADGADSPATTLEATEPATEPSPSPSSSSARDFFERPEAQVGLPAAALVLAGGVFAAYSTGVVDRLLNAAFTSGSNPGSNANEISASRAPDVAAGVSTAVPASSVVRRTSTSTKIELGNGVGANGSPRSVRAALDRIADESRTSTRDATPIRAAAAGSGSRA